MNIPLKLKFYYDFVLGQVYDEGHSPFHKSITADVVTRFIDPLNLPKTANIVDLGCGAGYFLDEMKSRKYTAVRGITMGREDADLARQNGHVVAQGDMNFLPDRDESVDLLFSRHSLEHSPFPYITLLEYNRVLKNAAYLYIEVPAPNCEGRHEENKNHYSVLDRTMWLQLLQRTGFDIQWFDYTFPIDFTDGRGRIEEHYYVFVCQRRRSVDVK